MTAAAGLGDRVALVTGASRGIGRATAIALAAAGAHVVFSYRSDRAGALATMEGIERTGRCAAPIQCELREPRSAAALVDAAEQRFGRLDVLVSNAGVTRDGVVWKMTDEAWAEVIETDLTATFRLIRAAVPVMRRQGHGRIVAISSINGLRGKFGQSNYAAAKAGLIGLIRSVAREVGSFGITANLVAPGLIETEMAEHLPADVRERSRAETVVGRLGTPEDVAAAVSYLASDAARHVTGTILQVDGGQRM